MDRRVVEALLESSGSERDALLYMAGYIEALEQRIAALELRTTPFGFPVTERPGLVFNPNLTGAAPAPQGGQTFFTNADGVQREPKAPLFIGETPK